MNPFRTGIGLLAQNLGIPVLPMRIDGLYELKQAGKKFAASHKVSVRIGNPTCFDPQTPPEKIASRLSDAVNAL
jgi:long-chain acyl-CoA synthetase